MKKFLIVTVVSLFGYSGLFSQSITLPEAVNIALKNSLDIELAKNDVTINTIYNNIGIAGGLPSVSVAASDNEALTDIKQKQNTGQVISGTGRTSNTLTAGLTGSILLYNGMRVVAAKHRLEELQTQSESMLNSQVQNVIASVMTAYYDVIRQQYYMRTIERSIDASKQRLDIVVAQQKVGLANNADLFQSQLDLNTLQQQQQSQLLTINQAKTDLLRLLTLRPDSAIAITDTIIIDKSILLNDVMNKLQNNADILTAQHDININEQIVKETAAQRYPSVRASLGYNYNRTQNAAGQLLLNRSNGPYVGINVGIPIYNGSVYKRQQKVAEVNVNSAEIQKEVLLQNYTSNVVKTYQAYTTNVQQTDAQFNNFKLAQQLLDLMLQKFQLRQATIVEVKQAQQSFELAAYSLINYAYAAKASEIELKRIANELK